MKKYKGKVGVSVDKGTLRLSLPRFLFNSRKYIYLGLPDTPQNRKLAKAKAQKIEADITYERFDFSLESYQQINPNPVTKRNTLLDLYQKYIEVKKKTVRPGTWKNGYLVMLSHLKRSPFSQIDPGNDDGYAQSLYDWASQNLSPDTCKRLMMQLNACIKWAIKSKLIPLNYSPLQGLASESNKLIRQSEDEKTDINPFSREERDAILEAFKSHKTYSHYYNYVNFCFYTGCRPSEAIALEWSDVSSDLSKITFKTVVVDGEKGKTKCSGLKTQKRRLFPCNQQVQSILKSAKLHKKSNLVFTAVKGGVINIGYFRSVWVAVLEEVGIEYRKPYQMRHTFISLCLESGVNVKDVARLVGNSPEIIYRHYAGRHPELRVPVF